MLDNEFNLPQNQDNPFRVPEGYFESLTERVMQQIPEESAEKVAVTIPLWRRFGFRVAAAVIFIFVGVGSFYLFHQNVEAQQNTQATASVEVVNHNQSATTIDQVADYIMCDNHDMYAYLSGE